MRTTVFLTVFSGLTFANPFPNGLTALYRLKVLTFINNAFEENCASDLRTLVSDASNHKFWAFKMLDSSGKIIPGILNGNVNLLGDYDQCLSINEEISGKIIEGQYCTAFISMNEKGLGDLNLTSLVNEVQVYPKMIEDTIHTEGFYTKGALLRLGLCLPKSCSVHNLQDAAKDIAQKVSQHLHIDIQEHACYYKGKPLVYSALDYSIYVFFALTFGIVLVSTICDVYFRALGEISNTFVIFSALTNTRKLFSKSSRHDTTLAAVYGVKAVSCIWIVLGHTMLIGVAMTKNPYYISTEWKTHIRNTFFWGSFFNVDTFFSISGLLVCYIYLKYSQRMHISWISFYMLRYARLIPALVAATFVQISVLKLVLGGPYGPLSAQTLSNECSNTWWSVFYSFIVYPKCILQAWYITADSQLYFFAPFILYFMKTSPRSVVQRMALVFILGIFYNIVVTLVKGLGFTVFEWSNDYKNYIHRSAFAHVPSWLMGIMCGYLIYVKKKIPISKRTNLVLFSLSLFTMVNLIINQISFVNDDYSIYRSVLWNALARPLWCLSLSFIVWSCCTGNGGHINAFLSNRIFRVLGKLTYSIYLVHHFAIVLVLFSLKKETVYFSTAQMLSLHLTILVISVLFAIPMYLAFEAPLDTMKNLMERHKAKVFI